MFLLKLKPAIILSLLLLFTLRSSGQQLIVKSLDSLIKPINTLKADSSFEDIYFLKEILKNKELISLGEITHGTSEVFQYKDRLVRFLVTNLGYKAIAFEGDVMAIENIDNYINGQTDSLRFLFGTPLISTNRKMIEWLRTYNLNNLNPNKIHVYGLEARGFSNIINKILAVNRSINKADSLLLEKVKDTPYNKLKNKDISEMKLVVGNLQQANSYKQDKYYVELLNQAVNVYYETKIGVRDEYMARNAMSIKGNAVDNKLIIWAHNGHVAKTELYNKSSMGTYLNQKYGPKYFVIATDFNHGNAYVNVYQAKNKPLLGFQSYYYPEINSKNAYEYYFKQCRFENFIIDVNDALSNPVLNGFFTKKMEMRMIGALSIPVNKKLSIAQNFDLIVYFNKTGSQWE